MPARPAIRRARTASSERMSAVRISDRGGRALQARPGCGKRDFTVCEGGGKLLCKLAEGGALSPRGSAVAEGEDDVSGDCEHWMGPLLRQAAAELRQPGEQVLLHERCARFPAGRRALFVVAHKRVGLLDAGQGDELQLRRYVIGPLTPYLESERRVEPGDVRQLLRLADRRPGSRRVAGLVGRHVWSHKQPDGGSLKHLQGQRRFIRQSAQPFGGSRGAE